MNDNNLAPEQDGFASSFTELETTFEEPITIRAYTSKPSSAGAFGTPQKGVFTDRISSGVVVEESVVQSLLAAGVYQAGDLVLQMQERLNESNENIGGSQGGDRILWRGKEYRLVQAPEPKTLGQATFWIAHLRRDNSASDQAGL